MAKHAVPPMDAVPLAAPYQHKVGKVTFVVSSFGNPKATDTAQQMVLRMLEKQVTRDTSLSAQECA